MVIRRHLAYPVLLALLLTVVLAGCQREPLPENGGVIGFSVAPATISGEVTKAATKADPSAQTDLVAVDKKVTVYGSYTAAGSTVALFGGVTLKCTEVSATGSTWTYSPPKYWSEDATHKFRAVFPDNAAGQAYSVADDKLSISGYSMATGFDLMVASAQQVAASRTSDKVTLKFRHACAAVRFQFAKAKGDTETYNITGLTLQDVSTTGTLDYVGLKDSDVSLGEWTPSTTLGSYTWPGTDTPWAVVESATETPVLYSPISPEWAFAVPQTLTASSALVITYDAGTGTNVQHLAVTLPLVSSNTTKIETWLPGKMYTYKVLLNPNAIELSVGWTDWPTENVHSFDPIG